MIQKDMETLTLPDTVSYSFSIEDIPPSPTQHVEFTITPKLRRSTLRKQRLQSDRNMQSLCSVSEDLRILKACHSRDGTPSRICSTSSLRRDLNNNISLDVRDLSNAVTQRRRADSGLCSKTATEGSLFEITSNWVLITFTKNVHSFRLIFIQLTLFLAGLSCLVIWPKRSSVSWVYWWQKNITNHPRQS